MHPEIRNKANAAGFSEADGTLVLIAAGVEDLAIVRADVGQHSVDTLFSILSLCSLPAKPHPADALAALCDAVLAPGGQLLFYEHVLSPLASLRRVPARPAVACVDQGDGDLEGGRDVGQGGRAGGASVLAPDREVLKGLGDTGSALAISAGA
jgi:hypothetical protein